MKKFLTLLAIALMAVSCNNGKNSTPAKGVFPNPSNASYARTFKAPGFNLNANADGSALGRISPELATKAEDNWVAYVGTYTVDKDGNYVFSNLGTIKKDGNTYKFIPEGGTDADAIEVTATAAKTVEDAVIFNRDWSVEHISVSFKAVGKEFTGLNLNEIETFAKDNGLEFNKTFKANMVAQKVAIGDDFIAIVFANGEKYCASYTLPNSSDSAFKIDEISELEVELLDGDAKYDILNGKLILSVNGKVNSDDTRVVVTLVPLKK